METNAIIGICVIGLALISLVILVVWSCRSIGAIGRRGFGSAREIIKEKNGNA